MATCLFEGRNNGIGSQLHRCFCCLGAFSATCWKPLDCRDFRALAAGDPFAAEWPRICLEGRQERRLARFPPGGVLPDPGSRQELGGRWSSRLRRIASDGKNSREHGETKKRCGDTLPDIGTHKLHLTRHPCRRQMQCIVGADEYGGCL